MECSFESLSVCALWTAGLWDDMEKIEEEHTEISINRS